MYKLRSRSATCLKRHHQRNAGPRKIRSESAIVSNKRQLVTTDSDRGSSGERSKKRRPNIRRQDRRPRARRIGRKSLDKNEEKFLQLFARLALLNDEEDTSTSSRFRGSREQGRLRENIILQQLQSRMSNRDRILRQKRNNDSNERGQRTERRIEIEGNETNNTEGKDIVDEIAEREIAVADEISAVDEIAAVDELAPVVEIAAVEIATVHEVPALNDIAEPAVVEDIEDEIENLIKLVKAFNISGKDLDDRKGRDKGRKRKLPRLFYVHDDPTEPKRICRNEEQ